MSEILTPGASFIEELRHFITELSSADIRAVLIT
jgi:hypothetical protein